MGYNLLYHYTQIIHKFTQVHKYIIIKLIYVKYLYDIITLLIIITYNCNY